MPSIRVSANGPAFPALLPVPAGDARAFQSRGVVNGYPGTRRTPQPPSGLPQDKTGQANQGVSRSADGPNWRTPGLYWTDQRAMDRAPVSVLSDNQMPVPAQDPARLPAVVMPGPAVGGQKQAANPYVAPKFLTGR